MKIGIIVDGQAEAMAYPILFKKIEIPQVSLLKAVYADMQPKATPAQIVKAAKPKIELQIARGADYQVLLIDKEDNNDCPPLFASKINLTLHSNGFPHCKAVIKNCCFENWLLADVQALRSMSARVDRNKLNSLSFVCADQIANPVARIKELFTQPSHRKIEKWLD